MGNIKQILIAVTAGIMLLACAEKEPVYPWRSDISEKVETNGKIVGYELYAKW